MKGNRVAVNLDYLKALESEGHTLRDVFIIGKLPTLFQMTVYLADGTEREFLLEGDRTIIVPHYKEAIEYTGFGARGLGNLIQMEAGAQCRGWGVSPKEVYVEVSPECFERIQKHGTNWPGSQHKIHINPGLAGLAFLIHRQNDGSRKA